MRIDLTQAALTPLTPERPVNAPQSSPAHAPLTVPAHVHSQDTANLSSSATVKALAHKALLSPEVRQQRVDQFAQAVKSGSYEVNPSKIADAIVADRVR